MICAINVHKWYTVFSTQYTTEESIMLDRWVTPSKKNIFISVALAKSGFQEIIRSHSKIMNRFVISCSFVMSLVEQSDSLGTRHSAAPTRDTLRYRLLTQHCSRSTPETRDCLTRRQTAIRPSHMIVDEHPIPNAVVHFRFACAVGAKFFNYQSACGS